jgi:hypothetical protein
VPPLQGLGAYSLGKGFVFTDETSFSYGTYKTSEGDMTFRALANLPIAEQLIEARKLGFNGVLIDLRGENPDSPLLPKLLEEMGKEADLISLDTNLVYFSLD